MQEQWPRTLEEAVRISILTMTGKEKGMLKNTPEAYLVLFHCNGAVNMRNESGLWHGNDELLTPCGTFDAEGASMAIIRAIWGVLQEIQDRGVVHFV